MKNLYWEIDERLLPVKHFLLAWADPVCWLIDKRAESILDVGCGQGMPMQMIKKRMRVRKSVGVDLFEPYIEESKKKGIHDEYLVCDIRKLPYKNRSFDVVLALQVLEHLPKKDAWKVLEKMEKIARKQVIVSTPIGKMSHPAVDNNLLQLHKSSFLPKEFEKRGYKTLKMGRKILLGENGIVHRVQNDLIRKLIFTFNLLITPLFYLFQPIADYYLVAVKETNGKNKKG